MPNQSPADDALEYVPPPGNQAAIGFRIKRREPYAAPFGGALTQALGEGGYSPPSGAAVGHFFPSIIPYQPPAGDRVGLEFVDRGGEPVADQFVFPQGLQAATVGDAAARNQWERVSPVGEAGHAAGKPSVHLRTRYLAPRGLDAAGYGYPYVYNWFKDILPAGFIATRYGAATAYNLRQYLTARGLDAQVLGKPMAIGGIKEVAVKGIAALGLPSPVAVNTTADQTAKPGSIAPPAVPAPSVSPRILFAYGIAPGGYGIALVQRNPAPSGFDGLLLGRPAIEQRTKYLTPAGIEAGEGGFPRVFDPTRKLFVSSVLQAGVFGDTRIVNRSMFVRVPGSDFLELSPWAYLENTRRPLLVAGRDCAAFGDALIANKSPSISPHGFDALAGPLGVGIGYDTRYVEPRGVDFLHLGAPALAKTPEIEPKGFAGATGAPTVWPRVRALEAKGQNAQAFGELSIWFRYRFLPMPGYEASTYGRPVVEHGRRELLASGARHSAHGTPRIGNANRTLEPASIWENFAHAHTVGGLRYLRPSGFDAARFGARIIPEIQQLYPQGFVAPFGLPALHNALWIVTPPGITTGVQPADRWGAARAWNLRQYVTLQFDPDSALNPPAWPQWTLIENRNRTIRTSGEQAARIGAAQIDNKARPLLPAGIEAPATAPSYRAGLVAYRVRSLRLEGMEAPYLSGWGRIHNRAAVLRPIGSGLDLWGAPAVENTRRRFERIGGFDAAWCGYPMVAERVRTLSFEGRYAIAPPVIRLPEVKLHTRYVDGIGYDASGIGWASLSVRWNRIIPRWTLQNLYGSPAVRNLTPELGTRGRATDEFGDTLVRLQWRPVAPDGASAQLFGRAVIAYRDRSVAVAGLRAWAFGDRLTVVKTGAPPYSTQHINLDGEKGADQEEAGEGQGIEPPRSAVPMPTINQHVIYVVQKSASSRFGDARVTANSIRVEPGYGELLVGEPLVALKVRRIAVDDFGDPSQPSAPRLSPHTIYAVMDAPEQAKKNHPAAGLHYVDGYNNRQPGVEFGAPSLSLYHRSIRASSLSAMAFGVHSLQLKRHYIEAAGIASMRFGWHSIPGTQHVAQYADDGMSLYGSPAIRHGPTRGPIKASPAGAEAPPMGGGRIENLHREVRPHGHYATLMGTRKGGDKPFMWQGLRVGPHVPSIVGGFQCDLHGEPWVSYRVREAAVQGFDAFLCEYQLEAFDKRMRVTRRNPYRPPAQLAPAGIDAATYGAPDARSALHFIRPDGNADQYRKGAF